VPSFAEPAALSVYEALLDAIPIGAFLLRLDDPPREESLRIVHANRACEAMLGLAPEVLIGSLLADRFPNAYGDSELAAAVRDAIVTGTPRDLGVGSFGSVGLDEQRFTVAAYPVDTAAAVLLFENLSASAARRTELAAIIDSAEDAIVTKTLDEVILSWNPAAERVYGYTAAEAIGRRISMLLPPDIPHEWEQLLARLQAGARLEQFETRRLRKDGEVIDISLTVSPIRDRLGRVVGATTIARDITERKRDEERIRQFAAIVEASDDAIYSRTIDGVVTSWNRGAEQLFGYSAAEMIGRSLDPLTVEIDDSVREYRERLSRGETVRPIQTKMWRRDGTKLDVSVVASPIFDDSGRLVGVGGVIRDIGDLLATVEALRLRTDLYAMLSGTNRAVSRCRSPEALYRELCRVAVEAGRFRLAWVGVPDGDRLRPLVWAGDHRGYLDGLLVSLVDGDPHSRGPSGHAFRTGAPIVANDFLASPETAPWHERAARAGLAAAAAFPFKEDDRVVAVLTVWADTPGFFTKELVETLSELTPAVSHALDAMARERLRRRDEEELRMRDRAIAAVAQGIVIADARQPGAPVVYASSGFTRLTGYAEEEVIGRSCAFLQGPDSDPAAVAEMRAAVREGRGCAVELVNYRKDGTPFWNEVTISPVVDAHGTLTHFVGVQSDVTTRRGLEAQLRQAHKLEAIGSLAGGVAHDFNNVLTAIRSSSDVIRRTAAEKSVRERAREIDVAAEHATGLTRQLLAFGRQQVLQPRPTDLNAVVQGTLELVERVIGEQITIVRSFAEDLSAIHIDPSQLQQVILNLAINARDAMPDGGTLVVRTEAATVDEAYAASVDVRPGSYVVLELTDSGAGIPPETLPHVFEPFFTTKPDGTGLGLATVFGIVKQSGGHVSAYSEAGLGTTFRVYLPPSSAAAGRPPAARAPAVTLEGDETILLVEDTPMLRPIVAELLRGYGYTVLEAVDGVDALAVAETCDGAIDLVLTDVVMPRMNGRELSERLLAANPALRVLFTSGYPADTVVRSGIAEARVSFIQKPYVGDELLTAIREALGTER
jgi:PAS domain S-box-containing protein